MKTLRKLSASALLMLVLALPVFAGDMHSPVVAAPPPPPAAEVPAEPGAPGGTNADAGALDPLTELSLLILQGALSLL